MPSAPVTDDKPKPAVVCVFCASGSGANPTHLASARALAHILHASNASLVYGGGTRGLMGELARTLVSLSGPHSVHGVIPRALIRTDPKYKQGTAEAAAGRDVDKQQPNSNDREKSYSESQQGPSQGKGAERGMSESELQRLDSGENMVDNSSVVGGGEYGLTTVVADMHTRKRLMARMVIEGGPGSGFVALAGGYGTIEEVMEMVTWNQLGIHCMPIVLVNVDGYWDGLVAWVRRAVEEGFVGEGNKGILVEVEETGEVLAALREYRVAEGRFDLDWGQR